MKERKRKHDDAHFPMQGKGKRATKPKVYDGWRCPACGAMSDPHLCRGKPQTQVVG